LATVELNGSVCVKGATGGTGVIVTIQIAVLHKTEPGIQMVYVIVKVMGSRFAAMATSPFELKVITPLEIGLVKIIDGLERLSLANTFPTTMGKAEAVIVN
jgi:hypothetical protein